MRQSQQKSCFSRLLKCLRNPYDSVDPDQTVCSGSTLFAYILNLSVMLGNYFQQTTFSNAFFSWRFKGQSYICEPFRLRKDTFPNP